MNMSNLTLITTFVITLTGCGILPNAIEKGSEINDGAVSASLFTLCRGASIGAIRREFGTPEKAETYSKLCGESAQTIEKIVK